MSPDTDSSGENQQNRRQLYEQLVGQTVADSYDIVSLMGYGGMGAVYEAVQRNMDRKVALKYIPTHDPVTAKRFEREALTVSKLSHPNTVTVFDYGQSEDGFLFLSMEKLSGRELTDLIDKEAPLAPERVVHIASQICRSLAEAHGMGIVHRDIKPDNVILIEVDGDPDTVKVLDFGIAKAVEKEDQQTLTGDGRIIGTPRYMSPEQILSEEIDHRSDIYSLGCIVFEMLCGAAPFDAPSTTELMISHAQDPPPPFAQRADQQILERIPPALEDVVRRAMSKSPAERPQSTGEMREELEEALDAHQAGRPADVTSAPPAPDPSVRPTRPDESGPAPRESSPSTGSQPQPRPETTGGSSMSTVLIGGIAVAALLVAAVTAGAVLLGDEPDEEPEGDTVAAEQIEQHREAVPPSEREDSEEADDSEPPRVEATETHHLRVETEPEGADLVEDGSVLGQTPLNLTLDTAQQLDFILQKDDYEDKEVTLEVDERLEEQTFAFELDEKEPVRAARPAPSPSPSPDEGDEEDEDDEVPTIELLDDPADDEDQDDDTPDVPTL